MTSQAGYVSPFAYCFFGRRAIGTRGMAGPHYPLGRGFGPGANDRSICCRGRGKRQADNRY